MKNLRNILIVALALGAAFTAAARDSVVTVAVHPDDLADEFVRRGRTQVHSEGFNEIGGK